MVPVQGMELFKYGVGTNEGYFMTLREELRQFMVACEGLLAHSMNAEELNHLEHELLQYYLCKVAQKFPHSRPGATH